MRHRNRGFTLIEVAIVLVILMVASFPAMEMFDQVNRQYQRAITVSSLKNDCVGALARIQAATADSTMQIDSDQRGASFATGRLRWDGETLTLTQTGKAETVLSGVRHASLFQRDKRTFLTLEVSSPRLKPYTYRTVSELGVHP